MKIHMNTGGLAATNAYLILDEPTKTAMLVDAPKDTVEPLLQVIRAQDYALPLFVLTHGHWDHLSDHDVVTKAFPDSRLLIHALDEPRLERPVSLLFELPYSIAPRKADAYLTDGQVLEVGAQRWEVLYTPGHAIGHVGLYNAEEAVLLAGDLLFQGSIGRTDLPDSNVTQMKESLRRVMQLPNETRVLSGHGPATTIGAERAENDFIRMFGVGG